MTCSRLAAACLLASLLAGVAQAGVTVVDPAGGPGYYLLAEAMYEAPEGEVLLLKTGDYEGLSFLFDKGLTLVGDTGATVRLDYLRVSGLPASSSVVLRNLAFGPASAAKGYTPGLDLLENDGSVLIEDCTFRGRDAGATGFSGPPPGWSGALVRNSSATFVRCDFAAGGGAAPVVVTSLPPSPATPGGAGLAVQDGRVALHECTLAGGAGGPGNWLDSQPADGGAGVRLQGASEVLLADCMAVGGTNGAGQGPLPSRSGDGLRVDAGLARLRHSLFKAGVVGASGLAGLPISAPAGATQQLPAKTRSVAVDSPLREGQPGSLVIDAEHGDIPALVVSLTPAWQSAPLHQGVLEVDVTAPSFVLVLAGAGATGGHIAVQLVLPDLGPGIDGLTVLLQLIVDDAGTVTFENTTTLAWLGASIP